MKEKYSYKWGRDCNNKWREEWTESFNKDRQLTESSCLKENTKLGENYTWQESWYEKYDDGIAIEKGCRKWNRSDEYFFENSWSEKLKDRDLNLWHKRVYYNRNYAEDFWEGDVFIPHHH